MKPLFAVAPPIQARKPEADAVVQAGVLGAIRRSGKLRVCTLNNRLPFSYLNRKGELIGLDIEMAHRLASDIGVVVEFVPINIENLNDAMGRQQCELAMAGIAVTPLRMMAAAYSQPYMDETIGFVVRDHLRAKFTSWESIRSLGAIEVDVPDIPYYVQAIRSRLPQARIKLIPPTNDESPLAAKPDAAVLPAERGSVLSMLHPEYSVVVPESDQIKVPLAYPLARRDQDWLNFINNWIELKRKDRTIDRLYEHWILGKSAQHREPRWSVIRNVLHWAE